MKLFDFYINTGEMRIAIYSIVEDYLVISFNHDFYEYKHTDLFLSYTVDYIKNL
jgi:hypothetical protein